MQLRFILALLPLAGCDLPPRDSRFRATGEVIAFSGADGGATAACFSCHGVDGQGDGGATPRLAGLDAGYLHRQLDDYASGRRDHAPMRAIAQHLDADDREKVAAYYAGLAPTWAPSAATASATDPHAARLYSEGDPARGLQACAQCHGENGEGGGPGNPPLAGQPADYMARQLWAWRTGKRLNDPLGEMLAVSRRLSSEEVAAVAAHAAALPGAHLPEAPAASRAARRVDSRNDALGPRPHAAGSSR
ncbi:cytochrome c precursor [Sphingobium sp. SYK-6]|nr:cytochrome c precursor [Sphingobium sp. SYK-6]